MDDLKLVMSKKISDISHTKGRRSMTDRKPAENESKMKILKTSSFKDANITKYIYYDGAKSEQDRSNEKKEQLLQPELTLLKSKTTCEVGDNPFLKLRKNFAQKEKLRSLKKMANKPSLFEDQDS